MCAGQSPAHTTKNKTDGSFFLCFSLFIFNKKGECNKLFLEWLPRNNSHHIQATIYKIQHISIFVLCKNQYSYMTTLQQHNQSLFVYFCSNTVCAGLRPARVAWKGSSYTRILGYVLPFFFVFLFLFLQKRENGRNNS
jgi:hypothetical protein